MTTFMGNVLPPMREGNVWAMLIYPGGRRSVEQIEPQNIEFASEAVKKLKAGQWVYVWLDDAVAVLQQANLPKVSP